MSKIDKGLQDFMEYTDEQAENLEESQALFVNKMPELNGIKMVATVTESENCGCKMKIGDRIELFAGLALIPSLCVNQEMICLGALAPLMPFAHVFVDRITSGLDPNKSVWKRVGCIDTGVSNCGWGKITMEISAEKVE